MALYISEEKQFSKAVLTLDKIKAIITPIAEKYQLKAVYIFGSYARGEATPDSDIDILIDREDSLIDDFLDLSGLFQEFKNSIQKEIDLVTLQAINNSSSDIFIKTILSERVKIYERKR